MDRTSILADTIDYMKELLDKISNLQQQIEAGSNHLETGLFKDVKTNEIVVRNSPKVYIYMCVYTELFLFGRPPPINIRIELKDTPKKYELQYTKNKKQYIGSGVFLVF